MSRSEGESGESVRLAILVEIAGMASESERVYDPVLGKVLTRLKKTAQQIQQECEEKNRCIKYAEAILREASRLHP